MVRVIITIRHYNYMSTSLALLNFNMCYGVIFTSLCIKMYNLFGLSSPAPQPTVAEFLGLTTPTNEPHPMCDSHEIF